MMFFVEAAVRLRDKKTITQEATYWKLPSVKKQIEYAPIKDIDFKSSRHLKKELDNSIDTVSSTEKSSQKPSKNNAVYHASRENFAKFLSELADAKPLFLSVHPCYVDAYTPEITTTKYPVILTTLYDPDAEKLSYSELVKVCENISSTLTVTERQRTIVEIETRCQASSKLWFSLRAGRMTASKLKAATATNYLKPSVSLVKAICYPHEMRFSTPATRWGIDHEQTARHKYYQPQSAKHACLSVNECGLFLSTDNPFLCATPDGSVSCLCEGCVSRCLEIPCNLRFSTLENPPRGLFFEICIEMGMQLKRNPPILFPSASTNGTHKSTNGTHKHNIM